MLTNKENDYNRLKLQFEQCEKHLQNHQEQFRQYENTINDLQRQIKQYELQIQELHKTRLTIIQVDFYSTI
jgi:chromosome segregation ATPase